MRHQKFISPHRYTRTLDTSVAQYTVPRLSQPCAHFQAVSVLKTSRQLDLIIRKGSGLDLFPGGSSGYNSSASSMNGDQSPSWSDSKRLSIVKEETVELEER
jgi:hypothetical protein